MKRNYLSAEVTGILKNRSTNSVLNFIVIPFVLHAASMALLFGTTIRFTTHPVARLLLVVIPWVRVIHSWLLLLRDYWRSAPCRPSSTGHAPWALLLPASAGPIRLMMKIFANC